MTDTPTPDSNTPTRAEVVDAIPLEDSTEASQDKHPGKGIID